MDYAKLPMLDSAAARLAGKNATRFRRITDRIMRRGQDKVVSPTHNRTRVLVVKLHGLGGMVKAGRALRSIREGLPNADITLLTTPRLDHIYSGAGLFDEVETFDVDSITELPSVVREAAEQLQTRNFEIAISLDGRSSLSGMLAARSGATVLVGLEGAFASKGEQTRTVNYDPTRREIDIMHDIARVSGGARVPNEPVAPVAREHDRAFISELFNRLGIDQHVHLVGFDMNAGIFARQRRWPGEKFALLAEEVEQEPECRAVFFAAAEDERYVSRHLKLLSGQPINLAGALSLRQFMAAIERLHLFVGCDSGPLHLARAMGCPTVGLFGPDSPVRAGWGDDERHAELHVGDSCSPCLSLFAMERNDCDKGCVCMHQLSLDSVRAAVMDLLDHLADPEDPPWLTSTSDTLAQ